MKDDRVIRLIMVMLAAVAGYTFNSGINNGDGGSIITGFVVFAIAAAGAYYIRV